MESAGRVKPGRKESCTHGFRGGVNLGAGGDRAVAAMPPGVVSLLHGSNNAFGVFLWPRGRGVLWSAGSSPSRSARQWGVWLAGVPGGCVTHAENSLGSFQHPCSWFGVAHLHKSRGWMLTVCLPLFNDQRVFRITCLLGPSEHLALLC